MDDNSARANDPWHRAARTKVERTRAALIAAAEEVFKKRGWLGARVEDIAREAGVSAATAYNHFPTKHSLIGHVYGPLVRESLDRAMSRLGGPDPVVEVLEAHVRELAGITRRNQRLTVAFVDAVQDYTIKVGGPPSRGDNDDPRNLAPFPDAVTRGIEIGQADGSLRAFPSARDLGPNITNLLLLRTITRPNEEAKDTAEFILTVMFGTLLPQLLVEAGVEGRPFRR